MKLLLSRDEIIGAIKTMYSDNIREAGIENPEFWFKNPDGDDVFHNMELEIEEEK